MSPLRIAFIGGGINSAIGRVHAISSQMDGKFKLVGGVFSRNKDSQLATEKAFGLTDPVKFTDIERLLDQPELYDVIALLTPTPAHYDTLKELIHRKIPVISEKALVSSKTQSDEISELIKLNPIKNAVTFNYTGYPMIRLMQYLVKNGIIGNITNIRIEMPQDGFIKLNKKTNLPNSPQNWRRVDGEIPTVLLDLAVHCLHLSSFITGLEPVNVFSRFKHHSKTENVIDDVETLMEYPEGVLGAFWFTKSALGKQNGLKIEIYGLDGSLCWRHEEPNSLIKIDKFGETEICKFGQGLPIIDEYRYARFKAGHPAGFIEAFANFYWDAHEYLSTDVNNDATGSYSPSFKTAGVGFDVLEAMVNSNKNGSWEKVNYYRER